MTTYLEPTQESGRAFFTRGIDGRVVMLNLLRYRAVADYSATPELEPRSPISGEAAYRRYMDHTRPHLERSGGVVLFFGRGGPFLVGPAHENDGRLNLFGALRTSMATCGYESVKEFQKAEVMVAPALQTEGKFFQRSQGVGMGH